jgi:sulfur-oxidizing protein SoxZ
MPTPMKIRALAKDGVVSVQVLIAHDMETGQRRDDSGALVPAWYIRSVVGAINGRPVINVYWGHAIAKNPYLRFKVRGAKAGDKVTVSWTDNRGEQRTDEAIVI